MNIGEAAQHSGLPAKTIRYYEEIGLLGGGGRPKGSHRLYDEGDVERLTELKRMRDLLNLSLDDLRQLAEAEGARAALRRQFESTDSDAERLRIIEAALPHVDTQLALVRRRKHELELLEKELVDKRRRIVARRRELST